MPLINKHEEEIPVETDGVSVGPGGRYCRVFRESAQRSGAVEKFGINWDDSQKLTQAVNGIYSSELFSKENMINWEDKLDTKKTWEN